MLYLEDYLEMIEHLPQELRDRFTEIRELDLQVENSLDVLEKRVQTLFYNLSFNKKDERDKEYRDIRKSYAKALEDADEKVQIASQVHDLVERYLRRLEAECHKFKMELEADNRGITEILEKRSLALDQPAQASSSQKENLYVRSAHITGPEFESVMKRLIRDNPTRRIFRRDSNIVEKQRVIERPLEDLPISPQPSALPGYNLAHIGAGGNAIAAAASQAIAATQQMQQGRRTASLKASYEAINTGVHAHELSIGRELAGAAHTALQASNHDAARKHKKQSSMQSAMDDVSMEEDLSVVDPGLDPENSDWTYDPNEPRYCICNQVSYGDMVACDNESCPFEWFHYPCVDMTCPPKGKWFCPQCTTSMRRRGNRKN